MTVTDRFSGSALRFLAVLGAMAMVFALLPQTAGAQEPPADPLNACPEDAPEASFTDREAIPPVHRLNVDCAAHFGIVQGFADNTYRPRLQVRRDQMASFIALTLDAANITLPAGDEDTFTDVGSGNVHADNINRLAAAGIVEGAPLDLGPNEYGPALRTRRDQMASFLMRAAGYALHDDVNAFDSDDQQFTDVPAGNVHFEKVNAAAENNIALGTGGDLYAPRDETRRDQMASFVVRLLNFILTGAEGGPLTLSLTPAACVVGEQMTARATLRDNGTPVSGSAVNFTTSGGAANPETGTAQTDASGGADFQFTPTEAGSVVVTVSGTNAAGDPVQATQTINCTAPAATGPITLDATSAPAGGSIAGMIANPGTVQNVAVTGCGFQNENVTIGGDGRFTLTIPGGQAPGACDLVFSILRTDGTSETQTIGFTVTAPPSATTAAPDLVSAAANTTTGVVTYNFDQNITGAALTPTDFRIYNAAGTPFEPTTVAIAANGTSVIAQYTVAEATSAVRATIRDAAVQDAAGRLSTAADAPLGAPLQPAGVTTAPDLESFGNCRTEAGSIVCDYRFDQPVAHTGGPGFVGIDPLDFYAIASDQSAFQGLAVTAVSVDNRTVSIQLDPAASTVPIGSLVRGAVDSGAVTSRVTAPAIPVPNPLQTVGRTTPPAFTPGAVTDVTTGPDLTSVAVVGTNTVAYKFDEGIDPAGLVAGNFFVYDAAGTETAGTTAVRSTTDTTVVNVTFPTGVVANAVGASVEDGAVVASSDGDTNNKHELPLQNVGFTAGRTALPDLVRVNVSINEFNVNRVDFVFDSALPAGAEANTYFALVDAEGTLFRNLAGCTLLADALTVRCDDPQFTDAVVAAAVKGSVQDDAAPAPPGMPRFTEGDVAVTR